MKCQARQSNAHASTPAERLAPNAAPRTSAPVSAPPRRTAHQLQPKPTRLPPRTDRSGPRPPDRRRPQQLPADPGQGHPRQNGQRPSDPRRAGRIRARVGWARRHRVGPRSAERRRGGSRSARRRQDGSRSARRRQDGSRSAEQRRDGSRSARRRPDGSRSTERRRDGSRPAGQRRGGSRSVERRRGGLRWAKPSAGAGVGRSWPGRGGKARWADRTVRGPGAAPPVARPAAARTGPSRPARGGPRRCPRYPRRPRRGRPGASGSRAAGPSDADPRRNPSLIRTTLAHPRSADRSTSTTVRPDAAPRRSTGRQHNPNRTTGLARPLRKRAGTGTPVAPPDHAALTSWPKRCTGPAGTAWPARAVLGRIRSQRVGWWWPRLSKPSPADRTRRSEHRFTVGRRRPSGQPPHKWPAPSKVNPEARKRARRRGGAFRPIRRTCGSPPRRGFPGSWRS